MPQKYFKSLMLAITFYGVSFAQTYNVFGVILDLETKIPLSDVNVFIKDINNGTMTNENGYFELIVEDSTLKNQILLNVEIIGYENKTISVVISKKSINIGKVFLKNKPIELEPLEIHSHDIKSKQISDIVIAGNELNHSLKSNIASTLSNHPNIGINSFGSVTSKPALRGLSGDRFLLTKDGTETGDLSQSSIDHAIVLDMTEVSEIEIIRGPKSLVYGPNAVGGVINTSLFGNPKIRFNKFHHRYLVASESFNNSIYGNIMLYIPIKNNQINVFTSNRKTENETSTIGVLENTKSNTTNYKLGFTRYHENRYINFIIERFNMDYGIPPTSNGHINGVDIFLLKDSYQINYHQDILFGNFNNFDIKYNFHDYVHLEIVNDETNDYDIFELMESNSYHVLLAKETNNIKIEFSSNNSIFGCEYNNKKFSPQGFYLTPTTKEDEISFYGFNQTTIHNLGVDILSSFRGGYLSVKPGEYIFSNGNANLVLKDENGNYIEDESGNRISLVRDREFKNLSFSLGIKKKIDHFEINSWLMHTMRPPRVEELYSDGPHLASYAFEIGNPNLKAERIYGIENSISYNSNSFNTSLVTFYNYSPYFFEMTPDGYCHELENWTEIQWLFEGHPCHGVNWIDWGSGEMGWLHKYSAKGSEVVIQGLEFDLKYQFNKMQLSYNFSFVNGNNLTLGIPLSYMNPIKQILSFDHNMSQIINYKIRLSKIHAVNKERLGEFETYTPGAFLTDITISFNYKMYNMTLQLNNVFDEEHYNHLSRIKNITPEAGRNIHLVCKVML